jgi:phage shock protein A
MRFLKRAFDGVFGSAEDPRKTIGYTFQRQTELLATVRRALADLAEGRVGLEREIAALEAKLARLKKQADAALAQGQTREANLILERGKSALNGLNTLKANIADIQNEEERLKTVEYRLGTQIEAILDREKLVIARHSASEARDQINQSMDDILHELTDLKSGLQKAEQRAADVQARASTIDRFLEDEIAELPEDPAH